MDMKYIHFEYKKSITVRLATKHAMQQYYYINLHITFNLQSKLYFWWTS